MFNRIWGGLPWARSILLSSGAEAVRKGSPAQLKRSEESHIRSSNVAKNNHNFHGNNWGRPTWPLPEASVLVKARNTSVRNVIGKLRNETAAARLVVRNAVCVSGGTREEPRCLLTVTPGPCIRNTQKLEQTCPLPRLSVSSLGQSHSQGWTSYWLKVFRWKFWSVIG